MRKIDKDLSDIPTSLNGTSTKDGKKTDRKRRALMSLKAKYKKAYDECYKWNEIQDKLASIYHHKCAYCEEKITRVNAENLSQKEEVSHTIEHYRPKSIYPWLAFSWDNLLWCCVQCNKNKADKFEILNTKIVYDENFKDKIHNSTEVYNKLEKPKMIHPELEDVMDKLIFDIKGNIYSNDERVKYTIENCKLDRAYLNSKRKKIYDDFIKDISDTIAQGDNKLMKKVVLKFKEDSENIDNEFIAFHIYILEMLTKGKTL